MMTIDSDLSKSYQRTPSNTSTFGTRRSKRVPGVACLLTMAMLLSAPAVTPASASTAVGVVAGQVSGASSPLDAAKVYAYRLTDLSLRKVATDSQGRFFFSELPAGLYKVIAHSKGFVPSVVMLARSSAGTDQFLDLQLLRQGPERSRGADFWAVRRQIPNDVLRDMGWPVTAVDPPDVVAEPAEPVEAPAEAPPIVPVPGLEPLMARGQDDRALRLADLPGGQLRANLEAVTGMDETISGSQMQMTGGSADIDARLGATEVGIQASFLELEQDAVAFTRGGGSDQAFALQLHAGDDSLSLRSRQSDLLNGLSGSGDIELEQYQLSWSRPVGERGRSELRAQYTEESNFYRNGWFEAGNLPSGSRTLSVEGAYRTKVGDQGRFETELRYRERQNDYEGDFHGAGLYGGDLDPLLPEQYETVELLSQGGYRMHPAVVVEYGMFTTLRDGSLSLTPRGSVLWQLNPAWEASLDFSHRFDTGDPRSFRDFMPALYRETSGCQQGEEYCYQISVAHTDGDNRFSVSALDRQFGETLRLYFSEDFFRQLESLYLVEGDRLPEVQVALSRRISPRVVATVESNLASGGGGLIYALGDGPYENQVRYLVTSVDTQFQATSTGVFVAFHQLQQELEPTREDQYRVPDMEQERLQLMLTQDLNFLLDLASTWAVKLNMEISRGHGLFTADSREDELRKRFLGGLAVRF